LNLGDVFVNFSSNIGSFTNELRQVNFELSVMASLAKTGEQQFRAFAVGAFYLGQTLFSVMMESVNAFGAVDQAIADLNTVLDTTQEGFENLKEVAIDWSNAHVTATTEVVESMYDMASAGLNQSEVLATVDKAATLATATMGTMDQATSLLTNTMNSFGKSMSDLASPTEKASTFMEAFAYTVQQFKVVLPELETGMSLVSGAATALGAEMQDVSVAFGAVKTAGLTASQTGTALKNFYERLTKLNQDTGIAVKNANGELLSVGEIVQNIKEYYGGAIDSMQEFADIQTIFGRRGSQVVALLQNQTEALIEHEKAVRSSASAMEMAEKREEGFQAQMQILGNRIENLRIAFGESFLPFIKTFSDSISNVAVGLQSMDSTLKSFLVGITEGAVIITAFIGVIAPLGLLLTKLQTALIASTAAMGAFGVAISTVVPLLPIIAGVIAAVTLGIAEYNGKMEEAKRKEEELEQKNVELAESFESLYERYNKLTKNSTDFTESSEELAEIIRKLAGYVPGFTELLTIDEEDIENSIDNLEAFGVSLEKVAKLKEEFLAQKRKAKISELSEQVESDKKALKEAQLNLDKYTEFVSAGFDDLARTIVEDGDDLGFAITQINSSMANYGYGDKINESIKEFSEMIEYLKELGIQVEGVDGKFKGSIDIQQDLSKAYVDSSDALLESVKALEAEKAVNQLRVGTNKDILASMLDVYETIKLKNLGSSEEIKLLEGLKVATDSLLDADSDNLDNLFEYTTLYKTINDRLALLNGNRGEEAANLAEVQGKVKALKETYDTLGDVGTLKGFSESEVIEEQISLMEKVKDSLREQIDLQGGINRETFEEFSALRKNEDSLTEQIDKLEEALNYRRLMGVEQGDQDVLIEAALQKYKESLAVVQEKLKDEKFITSYLSEEQSLIQEIINTDKERLELLKERAKLESISEENLQKELDLVQGIADIEGKDRLEALKDQLKEVNSAISAAETMIKSESQLTDEAKERLSQLVSQRDALEGNIDQIETMRDLQDRANKEHQQQLEENIRLRQQELSELETLNNNLIGLLENEYTLRERNFNQAAENYKKLSNIDVDLAVFEGDQFDLGSQVLEAKKNLLEFGKVIIAEFNKTSDSIEYSVDTITKSLEDIDFKKYGISVTSYTDLLLDLDRLMNNVQETTKRINLDGIVEPEELIELNELNNRLVDVQKQLVSYTDSLKYYDEQISRIGTIQANLEAYLKQASVEFNVLSDAQSRSKTESEAYEQALKSLIKTRAQTEDTKIAEILDEEIEKVKGLYEASLDLNDAQKDLEKSTQELEISLKSLNDAYGSVVSIVSDYNKTIRTNNDYVYDTSDVIRELEKDIGVTENTLDSLNTKLNEFAEIVNQEAEAVSILSSQIKALKSAKKDANTDEEKNKIQERITLLQKEKEAHIALNRQAVNNFNNTKNYYDSLNRTLSDLVTKLKTAVTQTFVDSFDEISESIETVVGETARFIDSITEDVPDNIWEKAVYDAENYRDGTITVLKDISDEIDKQKKVLEEWLLRVESGEAAWDEGFYKTITGRIEDLTESLEENKEALEDQQEALEKAEEAAKDAEEAEKEKEERAKEAKKAQEEADKEAEKAAKRRKELAEKEAERIRQAIEDARKLRLSFDEQYAAINDLSRVYVGFSKTVKEFQTYFGKKTITNYEKIFKLSKDIPDVTDSVAEFLRVVNEVEKEDPIDDQLGKLERSREVLGEKMLDVAKLIEDNQSLLSDYIEETNFRNLDKAFVKRIKGKITALEGVLEGFKSKYKDLLYQEEQVVQQSKLAGFFSSLGESYNQIAASGNIAINSFKDVISNLDKFNSKINYYEDNIKSGTSNFISSINNMFVNAYEKAYRDYFENIFKYIEQSTMALDSFINSSDSSTDSIENNIETVKELISGIESIIDSNISGSSTITNRLNKSLEDNIKILSILKTQFTEALNREIIEDYTDEINKLNTEFILFGDSVALVEGQISALESRISELIELKLKALKDENIVWTSELENQLIGLVDQLNVLKEEYTLLEDNAKMVSDFSSTITSGIESTVSEFFDLVQEFGSEEAWVQIKGKLEDNIKRNIINTIIKSLLETSLIKKQIEELTNFIVEALNDGLSQSEIGIIDQFIGSIGESVKEVSGVVDYLTNAFGLAGSASGGIQGALNGALVTLEEVRSGKVDTYFNAINRGDSNSGSILNNILGIDKQKIALQQQSNTYLESIARNTALSKTERSEERAVSNNLTIENINIDGGNITDAESFVEEIKPILEREFAFDGRTAGL